MARFYSIPQPLPAPLDPLAPAAALIEPFLRREEARAWDFPVVMSEALPPGTVALVPPAREQETVEEHAARGAVRRGAE